MSLGGIVEVGSWRRRIVHGPLPDSHFSDLPGPWGVSVGAIIYVICRTGQAWTKVAFYSGYSGVAFVII